MKRDQKTINEYWNRSSANYDRIIHDEPASFRVEGWQKQISAQVDHRTNLEVLDCGCGPGFFTLYPGKSRI